MDEELVEVIDSNLNTLKVLPRTEVLRQRLKHKAALVVVRNLAGDFFVHQRKATKKTYPLGWVMGAGGAVKAGESFEHAAARELEEELSVTSPLSYLFDFHTDSDVENYIAKVFLTACDGEVTLDPTECEQGKWVSLGELRRMTHERLLCPPNVRFSTKYLDWLDRPRV